MSAINDTNDDIAEAFAFPSVKEVCQVQGGNSLYFGHRGLTIRERFAEQFMAAMISNPVYDAMEACLYSERAVMYADRLIAELAKVKP